MTNAMKLVDAVRLVFTTTLSDREVGHAVGVAKNTVRRYRQLAAARGYQWRMLSALEPVALVRCFNGPPRGRPLKRRPDFAAVESLLDTNKEANLQLVWEDYRAISPEDALSYSQFTHLARRSRLSRALSMRQQHLPGEKIFVDFAGSKPRYRDRKTGEWVETELFVAALGASHYIYATCVRSQAVPDWIHCNVEMLAHFGGVPAIIVPDNLKSAVIIAGAEPQLQRTYQDFARHYNVAIMPARPRHPKDKAKAEVGVKIAQKWLLWHLRKRECGSLEELNAAVAALMVELNERRIKRAPHTTRRQRFEELDRPALRPLPDQPFVYAEWVGRQRVPRDYLVPVRGHFYSVPFGLVGQPVESRLSRDWVELFHEHVRVARHPRSTQLGAFTLDPEHAPAEHRAVAERTPAKMEAWAKAVGPNALRLVRHQLDRSRPELGLPACGAFRHLAERYGDPVFESAARRAVALKSPTPTTLRALLRSAHHDRATVRAPHALGRSPARNPEARAC